MRSPLCVNVPKSRSPASKSRRNFLEVLRAGHSDYVINAAALDYMRERALAGPVIRMLAEPPERQFADQAAWLDHLQRLGITELAVAPDPVRIATEGALWGSIQGARLAASDRDRQRRRRAFAVGRHGSAGCTPSGWSTSSRPSPIRIARRNSASAT